MEGEGRESGGEDGAVEGKEREWRRGGSSGGEGEGVGKRREQWRV